MRKRGKGSGQTSFWWCALVQSDLESKQKSLGQLAVEAFLILIAFLVILLFFVYTGLWSLGIPPPLTPHI